MQPEWDKVVQELQAPLYFARFNVSYYSCPWTHRLTSLSNLDSMQENDVTSFRFLEIVITMWALIVVQWRAYVRTHENIPRAYRQLLWIYYAKIAKWHRHSCLCHWSSFLGQFTATDRVSTGKLMEWSYFSDKRGKTNVCRGKRELLFRT